MQLIRNRRTRAQLWNRKARATRWGVAFIFPKPLDDEAIAVAEAAYTVSYDTMIEVYDMLSTGLTNSIPDFIKMTKERTELCYSDERRPYVKGHYSTELGVNADNRRAVLRLLRLRSNTLPDLIMFERLV